MTSAPDHTRSRLVDSTVCVVGLGLMGGSFASAIKPHCLRVVGIDRDASTRKVALEKGLVELVSEDHELAITADIVVLATPVRAILALIDKLGPMLHPGTILLDFGSTKSMVLRHMQTLPVGVVWIGGHPMCGKETSGIGAASAALFQHKVFVLIPGMACPPSSVELARELVTAIGAIPYGLDAIDDAADGPHTRGSTESEARSLSAIQGEGYRHDEVVAVISHLPYLLACGLANTAGEAARRDPTVWKLASSGFRDTSRVAGSDVAMMLDVLMTNRGPVVDCLDGCIDWLSGVTKCLASADEAELRARLVIAREAYESWRKTTE